VHLTDHARAAVARHWHEAHPHQVDVKIHVDAEGRVHVNRIGSSSPAVNAEVGHAMGTP